MRRCLHGLLVGVLAFSLAVDAARACGHLRCWRRCPPPCGSTVVLLDDGCGCGVARVVVQAGCEEVACGRPLDCCGGVAMATSPTVTAGTPPAAAPGSGSVVVPPPVAPTPPPAAPSPPQPIVAVPELAPVEPVSATEPAPEPAPEPEPEMPTAPETAGREPAAEPADGVTEPAPAEEAAKPEQAMEPEPAAEPAEEPMEPQEPAVEPEPSPTETEKPAAPVPGNIFEDEEAGTAAPAVADPLGAPADEPAEEAVPVFDAGAPADEPMEETPPAAAPAVEPEPAAEPTVEPAGEAAAEPLRRWIDDTASHAVVGRLVGFNGTTVDLQRADGRRVTVPLVRLSGFDRDYVAEAGPRVAAANARGPHPRETASR